MSNTKKTVCRCANCGRETYESLRLLPLGRVKPPRWLASCAGGPECVVVAQGRRIGLKEALKIVEHFKHHTDALYPVGCGQVRNAIRKAMKPPRTKSCR